MIDEIELALIESMDGVIASLKHQLTRVRTGRASASVLDNVMVDYYGVPSPINQVGQISTPEARLMQIQPYDKSMMAAIEKAIMGANLGVTPSNDGNLIRIPFPALTEERRKQQLKEIRKLGEDAKIATRNSRREQNDKVKKAEKAKTISEDFSKDYQKKVQDITDKYIVSIEKLIALKEEELFTV